MDSFATKIKKLHTMAEKENGTVVECSFNDCGYMWTYTGNMKKATCPSCSRKIDVSDCKVNS